MNTKWGCLCAFVATIGLLSAGCGASATPVPTLTPAPQETMTVTVFFSPDSQNDCAAVEPTERVVPASDNVATAALNALFAGPTEAERGQGYSSWFSAETTSILLSLRVIGSNAYVNLTDIRPIIPGASSSCGGQMFLAQVETTLKNAVAVERVFYAIEGDPVAFYEWIQLGCDPSLDNCDPTPFAVPG